MPALATRPGPETIAEIAEVVRAHVADGERERRLAMPVVDALRDAGLFRMLSPDSLGGAEADPATFFRTVEALGELDGSAAWCLFIAGGGVVAGQFMADEVAEEVFGDASTIIGGSVFPPGRAVAVDGGYRYSGQWAFASGCQHTNWLVAFAIAMDGDQPRLAPNGRPEMRAGWLPTGRARIVDTWDVSGLRGTGSHDFALQDEFLPERNTFAVGPGPKGRHYQGPLYRFPFLGLFGFPMGSVAIGIARAALAHCADLAVNKVPRGSEVSLRDQSVFQYHYADAVATLEAGRSWLYDEVDASWQLAVANEPIDMVQRTRLSLAAAHAVRSAATVADAMYTAGGGSALYSKSPLQRAMRDVHAITQHTAVAPTMVENAGKALLGLPHPFPLLAL